MNPRKDAELIHTYISFENIFSVFRLYANQWIIRGADCRAETTRTRFNQSALNRACLNLLQSINGMIRYE